ncbi:MAG TPA: alpha/beta hydrolase [Solirubrobacterales bacterium]|nr:alpha/beta hydrolase [Solirubrobacterales bacterium]
MVLKTRRWGSPDADSVVCIHGLAQHGGVFAGMAERLAAKGRSVLAVDLRGHGDSGKAPPWNIATHAGDVLETLDAEGIDRVTWVGHSFGGLLAATLAAEAPERTERVALLDPGLEVPPERALRSAEIERLDWSFATVDGAVNALLSNEAVVVSPREVVAAFAKDDLRKGPDGRFRFRFCPSTVVVAWSEMTLPAPSIARVPTLLVVAAKPLFDVSRQHRRYEEELGDLLTKVEAPGGHNVLWESPEETIGAVERFLEPVGEPAAG